MAGKGKGNGRAPNPKTDGKPGNPAFVLLGLLFTLVVSTLRSKLNLFNQCKHPCTGPGTWNCACYKEISTGLKRFAALLATLTPRWRKNTGERVRVKRVPTDSCYWLEYWRANLMLLLIGPMWVLRPVRLQIPWHVFRELEAKEESSVCVVLHAC